ncbi:hypothetical protein PTTG_28587 [Puccinia triticina 1-1 BBBD Race 1]|uniref:GCM domain-containing protein n=1 Tax=Puccinia triticina (isolate 1-1 / race 1 (BBBD)) TaxID=630390 RepID=A0A180GBM2_PUCT1|nr:hypothetical protein PTTG_28587 [Puccinia triticina 1-1 BBBD Race 1]
MNEDHKTFIDHGCKLDQQGYPLYPNGRTTFLWLPGDDITNFGTTAFFKRHNGNNRANGKWKVWRYKCLGALVCNNPTCEWAGPPPTGSGEIAKLCEKPVKCKGLAGECPGKVFHLACDQTLLRFDVHLETGWGLLRHKGVHEHPWAEAKKPDPLAKAAFAKLIKENPSAGAFKLKLGKQAATEQDDNATFEGVTEIHPSFQNSDRLSYHRKTLLAELGIVPGKNGAGSGDDFILKMFNWALRGLFIISSSYLPGMEHFTFQSEWMSERLLARDKNGEVYHGGLVSDVTYCFFENGYLLSTSMFCDELQQWIPVQLSWIRGLTVKYHQIHFTTLMRQFFDDASITHAEREILARQLVDFSKAQMQGHKAAYMDVTRIKRNRSLVSTDEESGFQECCLGLLKPHVEGGQTHEEKIDHIHRHYPKVRQWLDWWTVADVEAILFPSRRVMLSKDGTDGIPDTTNAQESLHRLYYMISRGKASLLHGMVDLFSFVKVLQDDWNAVMKGVLIKYGAKNNTEVGVSLGMKPAPKKSKKAKKSSNFVKAPGQGYASYLAANDNPARANRCWMAAALESLYAIYTPLWQRGINGKGTDLFTALLFHFLSRVTYELNLNSSIRSTLTRGQNKLWEMANAKHPGSFPRGKFSSCDFFIEILVDPTNLKKNKDFQKLFGFIDDWQYTCEAHPETKQLDLQSKRKAHVIAVRPKMFVNSNTSYAEIGKLMDIWTTEGIQLSCGRVCKSCPEANQPLFKPATPQKKKGRQPKRLNSEVEMIQFPGSNNSHSLLEISKLTFEDDLPPLHLNFHLEVMHIPEGARDKFMGTTDWPFKLSIRGYTYTLISQGYWAHNHYWAKMLRSSAGMVGVWLHNNIRNDGFAQLINRVLGSISGVSPDTSWLLYSRTWTVDEEVQFDSSMAKIQKDNKNPAGDYPFMQMKSIIHSSYNSVLIPHNPSESEPNELSPTASEQPSIIPSKSTTLANSKASPLPDIGDLTKGNCEASKILTPAPKPIRIKLKVNAPVPPTTEPVPPTTEPAPPTTKPVPPTAMPIPIPTKLPPPKLDTQKASVKRGKNIPQPSVPLQDTQPTRRSSRRK